MKLAPIISLGVSLLLGVAALVIGRGWLFPESEKAGATQAAPTRPAVEKAPAMQPVLVARSDIETGMMVTVDLVESGEWPLAAGLPDPLEDASQLAPQDGAMPVARGFIAAGEPILPAKLAYQPPRRYLAQDIPEGKRAASISVTLETGVAGFVLPGNRVDINVFEPNPGGEGPDAFEAEPLLKGVQVLAVDQNFEVHAEGAMPSRTVTLALSEDEVLKVTSAARDSQLGLALIGDDEARKLEKAEDADDRQAPEPKPVRASRTASRPAPKPRRVKRAVPARAPTPKPRPAERTEIDVVHGTEKQTVETPVAGEGAAS